MSKQLVIFEGISGSGKSTLFRPTHAMRHYQDLHIHRYTASHWVYAQMTGREVDVNELRSLEEATEAACPTLVAWLRCDPDTARHRKESLGDDNVEQDLDLADKLFDKYFSRYTKFTRVIELHTDKLTIKECVSEISKALVPYDR